MSKYSPEATKEKYSRPTLSEVPVYLDSISPDNPITTREQLIGFFTRSFVEPIVIGNTLHYSNFNKKLLYFTLRRTGMNYEVAHEVLQEAFMSCLSFLESGSNKKIEYITFITTVIVRRISDFYRTTEAENDFMGNLHLLAPILQTDYIDSDQVREKFYQALLNLNPLHCQILILRYFFEMGVSEIMDELNTILPTLKRKSVPSKETIKESIASEVALLFASLADQATSSIDTGSVVRNAALLLLSGSKVCTEVDYTKIENTLSRARANLATNLANQDFTIPSKPRYSTVDTRASEFSTVAKRGKSIDDDLAPHLEVLPDYALQPA